MFLIQPPRLPADAHPEVVRIGIVRDIRDHRALARERPACLQHGKLHVGDGVQADGGRPPSERYGSSLFSHWANVMSGQGTT